MVIGLLVRLASVCQIFSGGSSVVSLLHDHQKAAHMRGIFLDMLSRVCGHLLEYPMVVLAGDLNQTAFLPAFPDDFNTANFPCQTRSSQMLLLEQLFPAFLDTVGSRKSIHERTWWSLEKHGHDHLNMELSRMTFVFALKSAHVTTTPFVWSQAAEAS